MGGLEIDADPERHFPYRNYFPNVCVVVYNQLPSVFENVRP